MGESAPPEFYGELTGMQLPFSKEKAAPPAYPQKAGKENASKDVTVDSYKIVHQSITVEKKPRQEVTNRWALHKPATSSCR